MWPPSEAVWLVEALNGLRDLNGADRGFFGSRKDYFFEDCGGLAERVDPGRRNRPRKRSVVDPRKIPKVPAIDNSLSTREVPLNFSSGAREGHVFEPLCFRVALLWFLCDFSPKAASPGWWWWRVSLPTCCPAVAHMLPVSTLVLVVCYVARASDFAFFASQGEGLIWEVNARLDVLKNTLIIAAAVFNGRFAHSILLLVQLNFRVTFESFPIIIHPRSVGRNLQAWNLILMLNEHHYILEYFKVRLTFKVRVTVRID